MLFVLTLNKRKNNLSGCWICFGYQLNLHSWTTSLLYNLSRPCASIYGFFPFGSYILPNLRMASRKIYKELCFVKAWWDGLQRVIWGGTRPCSLRSDHYWPFLLFYSKLPESLSPSGWVSHTDDSFALEVYVRYMYIRKESLLEETHDLWHTFLLLLINFPEKSPRKGSLRS